MHHICDLINLEEISKWSEILPRFCAPHFELIYPDSAVQCWRHRQKSKWSELGQLFIDLGTGPQVEIDNSNCHTCFKKYSVEFSEFSIT